MKRSQAKRRKTSCSVEALENSHFRGFPANTARLGGLARNAACKPRRQEPSAELRSARTSAGIATSAVDTQRNTLTTNLLDFMLVSQFHLLAKTTKALSSAECFKRKSVLTPFHIEKM